MSIDLLEWLREQCAEYEFDVAALYRRRGDHPWPLTAHDEHDLERKLEDGGHFLPLPKEPAALANILEVSVVDYLIERVEGTLGLDVARGTERGYPDLEFTFDDYARHLSLICIYTLEEFAPSRASNLELLLHDTWRIASRQRSSTTREYLGAVVNIDALRNGEGEFENPEDFYRYWRRFNFRIGRAVQQQLDRLLAEQRRDG